MNSKQIKLMKKHLETENKKWSPFLKEIPKEAWPQDLHKSKAERIALYRSRDFLVQVFNESGQIRITANRTAIFSDGNWKDDLSWDDLQWIKNAIGYGDRWAVEVYPPQDAVVNVANMRHVWILEDSPVFGWKKS